MNVAVITEHSSYSTNKSTHFPLILDISICLPDLSPSITKTRWLTLIFRDFSTFYELSGNLRRKGSSEKSRFAVTVPSFLLHLVLGYSYTLFLPVSFPCVLSPSCFHLSPPTFIYLAALLLLYSPPPAHTSFHSLSCWCVCCQSLSLIPLHFLLFPTNFSLIVLYMSLVLYFTQSWSFDLGQKFAPYTVSCCQNEFGQVP